MNPTYRLIWTQYEFNKPKFTVDACETCGALVTSDDQPTHSMWHIGLSLLAGRGE